MSCAGGSRHEKARDTSYRTQQAGTTDQKNNIDEA